MCKYLVEMTDTFSGEANYSWLETRIIEADASASTRLLVRRAKRALGVTRSHAPPQDFGDLIRIDLRNAAICIFISPL